MSGQELKEIRESLHLSVNKAAKLSGLSDAGLAKIEKGGNITLNSLKKLMKTYKIKKVIITI